jgi:hypothetical protein
VFSFHIRGGRTAFPVLEWSAWLFDEQKSKSLGFGWTPWKYLMCTFASRQQGSFAVLYRLQLKKCEKLAFKISRGSCAFTDYRRTPEYLFSEGRLLSWLFTTSGLSSYSTINSVYLLWILHAIVTLSRFIWALLNETPNKLGHYGPWPSNCLSDILKPEVGIYLCTECNNCQRSEWIARMVYSVSNIRVSLLLYYY